MIPPLTLVSVPLPKKKRRMLPGCHAPIADADGEATLAAAPTNGPTGSPVVVAAAGLAVLADAPDSRRVAARAVHINGAAAGASPLPEPNQDNRFDPTSLTEVEAVAARGVAVATGAAVAAGTGDAGEELSTTVVGASTTTPVGTGVSTDVREEPLLPADGDGTDGVVSTGEVLSELCRVGAAEAGEPPPRTGESEAVDDGDAPLPRPDRRAGALALVEEPADADEPEVPVPVDPAEPVVSAYASGIAARPEPTPRATASAPTRPTYLA